eukprot:1640791-Pyramimonas_sp.AAC.1
MRSARGCERQDGGRGRSRSSRHSGAQDKPWTPGAKSTAREPGNDLSAPTTGGGDRRSGRAQRPACRRCKNSTAQGRGRGRRRSATASCD